MNLPPNANALWAWLAVDEAVRQGVKAAVLVPGARSIPLIWAWSQQQRVPVYTPWDERSAGYLALGLAVGLNAPVAVVTTSGTAVANLYPAVMEAERSQVPLVLMTADRPLELYDSGANQTVDQIKAFGERVRWFAQVPQPEPHPAPRTLRAVRTLVARAVARSRGWDGPPGPVHLNFPFRKPLEPFTPTHPHETALSPEHRRALQGREDHRGWTTMFAGVPRATEAQVHDLAQRLQAAARGLIVCGPRCPGGPFPQRVTALARRLGFPLLADPLSGVRFGPWVNAGPVLGGYALALEAGWRPPEPPQVILRLGAAPVGNGLLRALAEWDAAHHLAVDPYGTWHDPDHHLHTLYRCDALDLVERLLERFPPHEADRMPPSPWLAAWRRAEEAVARMLQGTPVGEGHVLPHLVDALPEGAWLVVGNSLPVRHLEEMALPRAKTLHVWGNRGTSGIDGVLSTGLGIACARPDRPIAIVLGDHSFLYELAALALVRAYDLRPLIVVIHNDGGGIFYRLPIHRMDPPFTPHIRHPHGLEFRDAAAMFGLAYRSTTPEELPAALQDLTLPPDRATLLVVHTDAEAYERSRQRTLKGLRQALEAS